jgi:hypothetical protein
MTYFLPVFFVCLVNQQCDFVYTDPLATEAECQQELKNHMDYLEGNPAVHSYRPVCLEIDIKGIST